MVKPHQILIIADDLASSADYIHYLNQDDRFTVLTEWQEAQLLPLCQSQPIDGIVLELSSQWCDRLTCLSQLRAALGEDCPPVVVIGCEKHEVAVAIQSFRKGAADYLVREQMTPEDLRLTLHTAIDKVQLRRELHQSQTQLQASVKTLEQQHAELESRRHLDVTNLFQAQQELRESEAELRYTVDLSPQSPWTATPAGQLLSCSEQWLNLIGLCRDQVLGDGWTQVMHPEDLPAMLAAWTHSVATGEPYNIEHRLRRADGSYLWMRSRAVPRRNEHGEIIRWYGTIEDIDDRKRSEDALRVSEAEFRAIANVIPALVWVCSATGQCVYVNQRYSDYTEQPVAAGLGYGWLDIVHPDEVAKWLPYWQDCWQTGVSYGGEIRYRDKEGVYRWHQFRMAPQRNEAGIIEKWFGCGVDIHDRKLVEAALHQSEDRLRMAIESAQMGTWDWNMVTHQGQCDAGWKAMFGLLTEAEIRTEHFWAALHPEDRPRVEKAMQWSLNPASGGGYDVDYRVIGIEDRVERWLRAKGQVYFDRADEPARFLGTVLDITEQKRAEATLKERNDHIQLLYETTHDLLSSTQPLAIMENIFYKLKKRLGLDLCTNYVLDTQQHKLRLVFHSGIPPHITQQIEWLELGEAMCGTAAQQRCPIVKEFIQYADDPQLQLAQAIGARACASQPLIAGDKVFGTLSFGSTGRDQFTPSEKSLFQAICDQIAVALDRSELLTSLRQQTEELLRVNRIKDEFLAILSHELRSPLNPILGWAKLLQSRKFDAAKTAEALATIERNAKLQTQLIDDLLDMAKILRGKLTLEMSRIDLVFVLEAAIDTVKSTAIAKNILLHPVLPQIGQVWGDATRLQQVVWNLLSNAIKFTPKQGQITICLERVKDHAQITVTDTGKGIHPEFLPHVFESFRQEDASITRRFGGLGLGLAIARQLVEAHGGMITAHSPGEDLGTTFTVQLPLCDAELITQPRASQPDEERNLLGLHILIVDDEPDARQLLTVILSEYGATVTTVTSAEEVLSTLGSAPIDLLVSDIGMPDVDGYSLIRQIRLLPPEEGGTIPAIALTAYAGEMNYQQAIAAGFQDHIAKPVEPQRLVQTIADLHKHHNR